ncbi:low affinity immunoglobulin gamma Fc region receptor III-like [Ammospiza nelsoni]|uniref:low affinity immunoglobulin gamma Fc region receptor III-like n=1 Tax=Ammospiza nelsoni TaxID=2857394 RepID=UPI00286B9017|nr:low affinity immunoglobulin gamma Fc region receptor III-like [Ammospiza nelsoni]
MPTEGFGVMECGSQAQTLSLAGAQTTQLLVDPPWRPAVLWDRVTLTCQGSGTAGDTSWYKDVQRWGQEGGNNLTVTENGTYTCERPGNQVVLQVPARTLLEGETLTLRCRYRQEKSATLVFYREETELRVLHNGTELSLSPLQQNHSGRYHCKAWVNNGVSQKWEESVPVTVTVHGTYQCIATNELGHDGHRVFRAHSPELALLVTPWGHRDTVAAGVGWALFFLLLLVGVIVAWHRWHRVAARKQQKSPSPYPLPPPEEGEVVYTHVVSTKHVQRPSGITDHQ